MRNKNLNYFLLCIFVIILVLLYRFNFYEKFIKQRDNYSIIFDCGSSGTRAYIYTWANQDFEGQFPNIYYLLDGNNRPVSFKITPGLSDFSDKLNDIDKYIKPLLDFVKFNIPKGYNRPSLYIMATAGMRLLPNDKKLMVLSTVQNIIKSYGFFNLKYLEVIDGSQEGYFMWLAINYLLGKVKNCSKNSHTVGSLEIGGASSQIALEIPDSAVDEKLFSSFEHMIRYKCSENGDWIFHKVVSLSYLGIGFHSARNSYLQSLKNESNPNEHTFMDHCLPFKCINSIDHMENSKDDKLEGTGKWDRCLSEVTKRVFDKFHTGNMMIPSSFGTIIQKLTNKALNGNPMEFIGLSEFWFGTNDFLKKGGSFKSKDFSKATRGFCSTDCSLLKLRLNEKAYPSDDPLKLRLQCFKSALILSTMREAFMLNEKIAKLTTLYEVDGLEAQWSIGALIHLILSKHSDI